MFARVGKCMSVPKERNRQRPRCLLHRARVCVYVCVYVYVCVREFARVRERARERKSVYVDMCVCASVCLFRQSKMSRRRMMRSCSFATANDVVCVCVGVCVLFRNSK